MNKIITAPLTIDVVKTLKAGDNCLVSGYIYTARDAAHKRMIEALNRGEELPFDIKNQIIYYVGPCPAREGHIIGSCGPTTSGRMDAYTPKLLELGLKGMIGKGERDKSVIEAMIKYGAVYFGAIGGAGALLAKSVEESEIIVYHDLGAEAIRRLKVKDFPVTVIIDCEGNNLYQIGRKSFEIND